jgi:hypothetical protein
MPHCGRTIRMALGAEPLQLDPSVSHARQVGTLLMAMLAAAGPALAQTTRVSVGAGGVQPGSFNVRPSVNAHGALIAFESDAANLVSDDVNLLVDVFVHERATGQTTGVSIGSNGLLGGGFGAAISATGRFVAFGSFGPLVPDDLNALPDIYLRDRLLGTTEIVSVATSGWSNGPSTASDVSADGRMVAFHSEAFNLVPGDANGRQDVFVRDRVTGQTTLVSVGLHGGPGDWSSSNPVISDDGRFVAFVSQATNLVAGDTNDSFDVFVRDLAAGVTTRVSVTSDGAEANAGSLSPALSGNGRFVAFDSNATNLTAGDSNGNGDIFVHDRETGETARVSVASGGGQANLQSLHPSLSFDGRFVAFASFAANLVPGDTNGRFDVFVHDRQSGDTERVSVASDGTEANDASGIYLLEPSLSGDGTLLAYGSMASNLVEGDTNGTFDVFVSILEGGPLPKPPTNLAAEVDGSRVTLAWTAPASGAAPDQYVVRVGFGTWTTDLEFAVGSATEMSVTDVPAGSYFVRVHGRNTAGTGRPSNEAIVVMGRPGAPLNLLGTVQGSTVELTWSPSAAGGPADSYVLRAGAIRGGTTIAVPVGRVPSYRAEQVPTGIYYVRVHGLNPFGESPPSSEVMIMVPPCATPPLAPAGLSASVSGRIVALAWIASSGCASTSYVLEAGASPGASDVYAGDVGLVTGMSATVSARTYHVRVRARNASGTSPPSNEVMVVVREMAEDRRR